MFLFFSIPLLSRLSGPCLSTPSCSAVAPCGGSFHSDQGEIISPNWPDNYEAQTVCTWRISTPSLKSIHVYFTHFDLQAVNVLGNCVDYVELFSGENMTSLG